MCFAFINLAFCYFILSCYSFCHLVFYLIFIFQENTPPRLVRDKRFQYVEQKGFQSFFENWKEKILNKETAMKNEEHDEYDNDGSDDEECKFGHL